MRFVNLRWVPIGDAGGKALASSFLFVAFLAPSLFDPDLESSGVLHSMFGGWIAFTFGGAVRRLYKVGFTWILPGLRNALAIQIPLRTLIALLPISAVGFLGFGPGAGINWLFLGWCGAGIGYWSQCRLRNTLSGASILAVVLAYTLLGSTEFAWIPKVLLVFNTFVQIAALTSRREMRRPSQEGIVPVGPRLLPMTQEETLTGAAGRALSCGVVTPFDGRFGWLRATFHEAKAQRGFGWPLLQFLLPALMIGMLVIWVSVAAGPDRSPAGGFGNLLRMLIVEPRADIYSLEIGALVLFACIAAGSFPIPILNRRYPRSREQLAETVFLSSLAMVLGFLVAAAVFLGCLAAITVVTGESLESGPLFALVRVTIFLSLCIPCGQWIRAAELPQAMPGQFALLWLFLMVPVSALAVLGDFSLVTSLWVAVLIPVLAGLSQARYRLALRRHFQEIDLI